MLIFSQHIRWVVGLMVVVAGEVLLLERGAMLVVQASLWIDGRTKLKMAAKLASV